MTHNQITRLLHLARKHVFDDGRKGAQAERLIPRLKSRLFTSPEHQAYCARVARIQSERLLSQYA